MHSGDAMSPDTRRELVGSRLMVLVQPLERGVQERRRVAHTFGARDAEGRARAPLCLFPVVQKKGEGGARRDEARVVGGEGPPRRWWGAARSGGEAAHAPRIGIDPTSRQHLVAPHVPR